MFTYTRWANERFIEAIRGLSQEQYVRPIESSFPTIRDTLGHIVFAEWLWLRRWNGESPSVAPAWTVEPALETLALQARTVADERSAFLETVGEQTLAAPLAYRTMAGDPFVHPLGELLTHVANHSTYHRGQLTTMLRQAGASPPSTDYSVWLRTSSE